MGRVEEFCFRYVVYDLGFFVLDSVWVFGVYEVVGFFLEGIGVRSKVGKGRGCRSRFCSLWFAGFDLFFSSGRLFIYMEMCF